MFRTIVVGTDGSPTAAIAVDQAGDLAKSLGATVHLVTAYAGTVRPKDQLLDREKVAGAVNEILERAAGRLRSAGIENVQTHDSDEDDPAEAILGVAEDVKADLIVVGNKGVTGMRRFLIGSVAQKVVQHAPCGVLVCRTS